PTCREADTERFDRSTFSLDVEVARFDTASADWRQTQARVTGGARYLSEHPTA
ncbi:hypothetical protein P3T42_002108, partial [Paraburkholderia sp. GAS38]